MGRLWPVSDPATQVLAELGIEANVSRIDDPHEIARYVLAEPPGLVINGELVSGGGWHATWVGEHDAEANPTISLSIAVYLALSSYLAA